MDLMLLAALLAIGTCGFSLGYTVAVVMNELDEEKRGVKQKEKI